MVEHWALTLVLVSLPPWWQRNVAMSTIRMGPGRHGDKSRSEVRLKVHLHMYHWSLQCGPEQALRSMGSMDVHVNL